MKRLQVRQRERMRVSWRQALCAGAGLSSVMAASPPALAQEKTIVFSIDSQPLSAALLVFGRQASVSVLAPNEIVSGLTAPDVRGELSASAALARLLAGTGLEFEFVQADAVRIKRQDHAGLAPGEQQAAPAADYAEDNVVITGTTIAGIYPASAPIEIYTQRDIVQSGATTTEQFVAKLPQNLGGTSQYGVGSTTAGSNYDSVTGVDLRGLGVGTTLTLVNGRRMALSNLGQSADISMIPVGAVARVEVLTDGASAIYGSDAVGGVINFILRDDFEGAESRLSIGGVARGGMRQGGASHMLGFGWDSGHGLVSYNYHNASALKRSDRDYALASGPGTLTPTEERQSLFATASQDIGDQLTLDGHFSLGKRDVKNEVSNLVSVALTQNFQSYTSETDQYSGDLTLNYQIAPGWRATLGATYSEVDVDGQRSSVFINRTPRPAPTRTNFSTNDTMVDVSGKIEGRLWELPGGDMRFSVGGGVLDQTFKGYSPVSTRQSAGTLGRRSPYAFVELFAPLASPSQNLPLLHKLELSVAARYTDYQDKSSPAVERDFGDSIDPKVGLYWAPVSTLGLRATYGTSFRAPFMSQLDPTGGAHYLTTATIAGVPNTPYLGMGAYADRNLAPETATTYTAGFDYRIADLPDFRLAATYYNISYEDRIAIAPFGGLSPLTTPALLPDVIYRAPSAAFIEDVLTTTRLSANTTSISLANPQAAAQALYNLPNFWIYDTRYKNLAVSEQDGIDLTVGYGFGTPLGDAKLSANVTHILNYTQQGSPSSSPLSVTDVPGTPANWRGRVVGSLSNGPFDGALSLNVVDEYANPQAVAGRRDIESWTTFDLNLSYDFGALPNAGGKGPRISLSAQNLFDQDPPYLINGTGSNIIYPIGFDPANANPLGRLVTLNLTQRW